MKRAGGEEGRSESGPPEPWRRRALSYVYILRSLRDSQRIDVGWTNGLRQRLQEHNWGMSPHTGENRPWEVAWYAGFLSEEAARDFERYLKSGSGRAFLRKRLLG
jgi:putative endonuclease